MVVLLISSEASYQSTVMEKKVRKKTCAVHKKNVRRRPLAKRSFRRAIASSVHAAAVGSAYPTHIFPASGSEHRPRHGGARLAYRDPSGER